MRSIAVFTDTYLPTINGASYTIAEWRSRWLARGGRMDVVYPDGDRGDHEDGEIPVRSIGFPFYPDYRLGLPHVPAEVRDVDVVHVHTPFSVGFAGVRLARQEGLPLVASYHTPTSEYTRYLLSSPRLAAPLQAVGRRWERLFYDRAEVVLAPSERTRAYVESSVGVSARVEALSNGVDVERFRPVDPSDFLDRIGVDADGPIVGYTGRHGYEKRLEELVDAADGLDATVLLGGDGPARGDLEARAADTDADVRFLGFMDRSDLPAFYSALDVFAFPSPVETQGIVALEAMACGTPVVGANQGALADTIEAGETGHHYESGDVDDFRAGIERALAERSRLRQACLDRRDSISVEHTIDLLDEVYASIT